MKNLFHRLFMFVKKNVFVLSSTLCSAHCFSATLFCQSLLQATLFPWLEVKAIFFDVFANPFTLYFSAETTHCFFKGFVISNVYLNQGFSHGYKYLKKINSHVYSRILCLLQVLCFFDDCFYSIPCVSRKALLLQNHNKGAGEDHHRSETWPSWQS